MLASLRLTLFIVAHLRDYQIQIALGRFTMAVPMKFGVAGDGIEQ
jgi:hypothetical protein